MQCDLVMHPPFDELCHPNLSKTPPPGCFCQDKKKSNQYSQSMLSCSPTELHSENLYKTNKNKQTTKTPQHTHSSQDKTNTNYVPATYLSGVMFSSCFFLFFFKSGTKNTLTLISCVHVAINRLLVL